MSAACVKGTTGPSLGNHWTTAKIALEATFGVSNLGRLMVRTDPMSRARSNLSGHMRFRRTRVSIINALYGVFNSNICHSPRRNSVVSRWRPVNNTHIHTDCLTYTQSKRP